jgi:hypothetical protein
MPGNPLAPADDGGIGRHAEFGFLPDERTGPPAFCRYACVPAERFKQSSYPAGSYQVHTDMKISGKRRLLVSLSLYFHYSRPTYCPAPGESNSAHVTLLLFPFYQKGLLQLSPCH